MDAFLIETCGPQLRRTRSSFVPATKNVIFPSSLRCPDLAKLLFRKPRLATSPLRPEPRASIPHLRQRVKTKKGRVSPVFHVKKPNFGELRRIAQLRAVRRSASPGRKPLVFFYGDANFRSKSSLTARTPSFPDTDGSSNSTMR